MKRNKNGFFHANEIQFSKRMIRVMLLVWIGVCAYSALFETVKLITQIIYCPNCITASMSDVMSSVATPIFGIVTGYIIKSALEKDKLESFKAKIRNAIKKKDTKKLWSLLKPVVKNTTGTSSDDTEESVGTEDDGEAVDASQHSG